MIYMNIEKIAYNITKNINNLWPDLYKIRYVYLELGKIISRDTDFFFSIDNKLYEYGLSYEEIKNRYESNTGVNNKVICHSACQILKYILDTIGINSKIIKSKNNYVDVEINNKKIRMYHYMLVANDGNNDYFLSLTSDLPYIKEGMKTKHFANHIPYKKELSDGRIEQVYEGKEINDTVLLPEELRKIDEKIGYINTYYNYNNDNQRKKENYLQYNDASLLMIKDEMNYNKLYYNIEAKKTKFYRSLYNFNGANNRIINFSNTPYNEITKEDWNIWIKKIASLITNKLNTITGYNVNYLFDDSFNYDNWLKFICKTFQKEILKQLNITDENIDYVDENFSYSKWSKNIKKEANYNKDYDYENIISILDLTNTLINYINTRNGNFNYILSKLSFHFIYKEFIITNEQQKNFISTKYIAHKFRTIFNQLFNCNKGIFDFNMREYSEQVVIIKEIIELMFPELNYNNSNISDFNDKYTAVQNRIHIYPVKNIKNNSYSIVFNIVGNNQSGDYYYLYNLKQNQFDVVDILEVYNNYIIVSERFKNRLEELEDIGLKK